MDDYDYLYKIVLVGDSGVGKSSLLRCLKDQEFVEDSKATIGIEFGAILKRHQDKNYKIQVWDTAGQERFRSLTGAYFRGSVGVILVYDITRATSFHNLDKWLREVREHCDRGVSLILLGNKSDQWQREVGVTEALEFALRNGCPFLETSAKNSQNVHAAIETLVFGGPLAEPVVPVNNNFKPRPNRQITGGTTNLPLVSMDADCDIYDTIASVNITQVFKNTGDAPQELIVGFPIEEFGSVCKFEGTKSNGEKIVGKVLEKVAATNKYDDAISEGKTAILLEESPGNVFKASVGMLPPGETMTLQITYVTELQVHRKREFKFTYKTLLDAAERTTQGKAGKETVRPKTSLEVRVHGDSDITDLRSYSHDFTERRIDGREGLVRVEDGLLVANFEMYMSVQKLFIPRVLLEYNEETASTAVMVTTVPNLPPPNDAYEIIFVIDRSGSMAGEFWKTAQSALQLFLRSLPSGSYFNVVGFGSTFVALFEHGLLLDAPNFKFANDIIASWGADLGGTEMEGPLNWIYESPIPRDVQKRRIILLTDGRPDKESPVLQAAAAKISPNCELFCMGIGGAVSERFLNQLSETGKGYCELAPNVESLSLKVIRQLKRALDLDLKNARVTWKNVPSCKLQDKVPEDTNAVFIGGKLVLYSLLENRFTFSPDQKYAVIVEFTLHNGEKCKETVTIDPSLLQNGSAIHSMAAKHFIRVLLAQAQASQAKSEVVRISTTYGVSSIYASFVAVEEKASGEAVEKTMEKVEMEMPHSTSFIASYNSCSITSVMRSAEVSSSSEHLSGSAIQVMSPSSAPQSAGCCNEGSRPPYPLPNLVVPNNRPVRIYTEPFPIGMVQFPKEYKLTLSCLISHQNFDGSWEPRDVAQIFSISENQQAKTFGLETLPKLSSKEKQVENICLATAIVVAFLESRYKKDGERWEMMAEKSYEFLEKTIPTIASPENNAAEKWVAHVKNWMYQELIY